MVVHVCDPSKFEINRGHLVPKKCFWINFILNFHVPGSLSMRLLGNRSSRYICYCTKGQTGFGNSGAESLR